MFGEFEIVRATPVAANEHLVELSTFYTLLNRRPFSSPSYDNRYPQAYHQSVIVDQRDLTVVSLGESVAHVGEPPQNSLTVEGPKTPTANAFEMDMLLSSLLQRPDIIREAIVQSRPELKDGGLTFGEFEIVAATPVDAQNRLVEVEAVYTLKYAYGSVLPEYGQIDEKVKYRQTVLFDERTFAVIEFDEAVAGVELPDKVRSTALASSPKSREDRTNRRLLLDWQLRSDIVRRGIANSDPEFRNNLTVFKEFEIVAATPVDSTTRLVELTTVYTLLRHDARYAGDARSKHGARYQEALDAAKVIYQRTVIVDDRNATVVELGKAVAMSDPLPQDSSGDTQIARRPPVDEPTRITAGQNQLLSEWQLRSDIVRKAIAKSHPELRTGSVSLDKFEIVGAMTVDAQNRLVELKTIYSLKYSNGSISRSRVTIDEDAVYRQTVIVDQRELKVVRVDDAETGNGGSKFAEPQKNSRDDDTLLAETPDDAVLDALSGG